MTAIRLSEEMRAQLDAALSDWPSRSELIRRIVADWLKERGHPPSDHLYYTNTSTKMTNDKIREKTISILKEKIKSANLIYTPTPITINFSTEDLNIDRYPDEKIYLKKINSVMASKGLSDDKNY